MKNVFVLFGLIFSLQISASAMTSKYDFEGFIRISSKKELFVQWHKAEGALPTVILLNGLTYSTKQWDEFGEALHLHGVGVVMYDMDGMGQTLLKYAPVVAPITYQTQIQDLKDLITKLKIGKANLVGLSYGGGVAIAFGEAYPHLVNNLILMAPYTAPVATQDLWIKMQVLTTRMMYPYNPYSNDELYDYFLKQNVYGTYPMAEPIVLENPFKLESTFRMVQGIRKLDTVKAIQRAPVKSVHLVIAGQDEYIDRAVLEDFWSQVPESAKASKIVLLQSKHKIPEEIPEYSADWIATILLNSSRVQSGQLFEGNPATGLVRAESGDEFEIGLNKKGAH